MAKYRLGPHEYPSKKAAQEEFKRILWSVPLGGAIGGSDAELVALLIGSGKHPESVDKIGPGIASIEVRDGAYGTRCFWLVRTDGTVVDFSYPTALSGPVRPKTGVLWAMREEVDDQIRAFKEINAADLSAGRLPCGICREPLTPFEVHVDHGVPTFEELATRFVDELGDWEAIAVECVGATGRRLADRGAAEVWQVSHAQTAQLRLTHSRCNLTRKRT